MLQNVKQAFERRGEAGLALSDTRSFEENGRSKMDEMEVHSLNAGDNDTDQDPLFALTEEDKLHFHTKVGKAQDDSLLQTEIRPITFAIPNITNSNNNSSNNSIHNGNQQNSILSTAQTATTHAINTQSHNNLHLKIDAGPASKDNPGDCKILKEWNKYTIISDEDYDIKSQV